MAKNSKDVYGAKGKGNALDFDPEDLMLVEDPAHPLYDERVHWPVDESMVRNIMFQGVLQPIEVNKNPETGQTEVVTGRQRVKAAREANRRLREQGREIWLVPATVRRLPRAQRSLVLSAAMASENAIRQQETPMTTAAKMARQANMGRSEDDIAIIFGCNVATVRSTLALLDCCEAVQKAVDSGEILVTHARALAKVSPTEQRAKVRELKEAAAGKKGHERSRAQRAVMDSGTPRMRSKAEIRAEMEQATGERADALRWVLGLDGQPPAVQAGDSRQMTIEGTT
ncbi:ParB/RepB/Spo0J family partition protein [Burkholderia cenocepacia]